MSRHLGTPNAPPCGCEPEFATPHQLQSIAALGVNPVSAREDRPVERAVRRELRRSYGCDCCGDADAVVRPAPEQADAVLSVVQDWTGVECRGCPWRAMRDPFVCRVFDLWTAFDKQQLAIYRSEPSHRELEGVMFLQTLIRHMDAHQITLDRQNRPRPEE